MLQVLPGSGQYTGRPITSNPLVRKVDITVCKVFALNFTYRRTDCIKAGTTTGRSLGQIVGSNLAAYTAELGGKAPVVVFDDADLESAVNGAAFASFVASGQTCVSGTRLIVQSGIYEEFMERFLAKVESIRRRMGDRTSAFITRSPFQHPNLVSLRYSDEPCLDDGHNHLGNPPTTNRKDGSGEIHKCKNHRWWEAPHRNIHPRRVRFLTRPFLPTNCHQWRGDP